MQRKATVDRILPHGKAELIIRRESACSGDCHKCAGCGAVEQTLRLTADNHLGAKKGDIVWIESESRVVLKGAALVYLLPLLLFLTGYLAACPLGGWAAAVGGGGFALGLIPALIYDRRVKNSPPDYRIIGLVK